jgi:hypothetical protein
VLFFIRVWLLGRAEPDRRLALDDFARSSAGSPFPPVGLKPVWTLIFFFRRHPCSLPCVKAISFSLLSFQSPCGTHRSSISTVSLLISFRAFLLCLRPSFSVPPVFHRDDPAKSVGSKSRVRPFLGLLVPFSKYHEQNEVLRFRSALPV